MRPYTNMDRLTNDFARRYEAKISLTGERVYHIGLKSYQIEPTALPFTESLENFGTSEVVRIELPEYMFRHVLELTDMLSNPPDHYRGQMVDNRPLSMILSNVKYESRIRNQIPAVKKAWEKYQTLLKLSGGYDTNLDEYYRR